SRYPVNLAAFSLIWVGVLWPLDYFWAHLLSLPGPLITPECALAFMLCGFAIAAARRHGQLPWWLGVLTFASSVYCLIVSLPASTSLLEIPLSTYVNEAGASSFLILLTAAIYLSRVGGRARRLAWFPGLGIAAGLLAVRVVLLSPPRPASYHSTADMAAALLPPS